MSSVQIKGFATTCLCSLVHELLSFPRAQMAAKHAREIVLFQTSTTFTIPGNASHLRLLTASSLIRQGVGM